MKSERSLVYSVQMPCSTAQILPRSQNYTFKPSSTSTAFYKLQMNYLSVLLLSLLSAAEMPSKPTALLRFDGFGVPQALLHCGPGGSDCTVPKVTQSALDSFPIELTCAEEVLGEQGPIQLCRLDPLQDRFQDSSALLGSDVLTWVHVGKIPGMPKPGSNEEWDLLKRHRMAGPPLGSRHGNYGLQAVLRTSEEFCQAPTPLGEFLRAAGQRGFEGSVREVYNPQMEIPALLNGQQTKYFFRCNTDTFTAATAEIDRLLAEGVEDPSIMVVNFANNKWVGGGYKNGSRAQEEDLFRCSTLPLSLTPHGEDPSFYPINDVSTAIVNSIYTPHVHIIRKSSYKFMSEEEVHKYKVSVCSVAALDCNDKENARFFSTDCVFTEEGYTATMDRIGNMFQMAVNHKVDSLILGAFGCGVFKNKPESIIKIYEAQMQAYHNAIPNVVYAIIGEFNVNKFFKSPETALKCPADPIIL